MGSNIEPIILIRLLPLVCLLPNDGDDELAIDQLTPATFKRLVLQSRFYFSRLQASLVHYLILHQLSYSFSPRLDARFMEYKPYKATWAWS